MVISQLNISAADGSTTNPSTGDFAKSLNSFLILVVAILSKTDSKYFINASGGVKRENEKKG